MAAVALSAACSEKPKPTPAPPQQESLPMERAVEGTVLDNAGKPVAGAIIMLDGSSTGRGMTGPDGRFGLGRASVAKKHSISVKLGADNQFVRSNLGEAGGHIALDFDVPWGRGSVALGNIYAESPRQNDERVARDLGPVCTRAWADKPLELAPEQMPVVLERKEREAWRGASASVEASQLAGVAAICTQTSQKVVGQYEKSKTPAYDITWQVVMALRDGRSVRKTFKAPAPLAAATTQYGTAYIGAETGQARQLESDLRAWVASTATGGAAAAAAAPSAPPN